MLFRPQLTVVFIAAALTSCGGTDSVPQASAPSPPLFDLLPLAGAAPPFVDNVLGAPTSIVPIENNPEEMPGEFRDYQLAGAEGPITVRFHRNRAVFFTVFLPEPVPTAQAALQRVGLEPVGNPQTVAPAAEWWRDGTLSGKSYVKIGGLKGMSGATELFDMVQAHFR